MADQIVITEKTSQAKDVRSAIGARYGDILPAEAHSIVQNSLKPLRQLLVKNIEAERPRMPAGSLADIVMTFFVGTSLEQNLATTKTAGARKIEGFMQILRSL